MVYSGEKFTSKKTQDLKMHLFSRSKWESITLVVFEIWAIWITICWEKLKNAGQ